MHPITQSYLNQFTKEQSIESMDEADRFERFVNHCIISNRCAIRFDVEDVTTGDGEVGIDGVAILIGEELVTTADAARFVFGKRRRDIDVKYLFIQTKRSESFDRDGFLNLGSAVRDLLSSAPKLTSDNRLEESCAIHRVVVENVNKIRNGQPDCMLFYATTGTWTKDKVLDSTRLQVIEDIVKTRFFNSVTFTPLGFDEIRREWMATRTPPEATFSVLGELPIPAMEGVSEALVILVSAQEFVRSVLCDDKGNLRANIFEQNVRHFLGDDNDVNAQIKETLKNNQKKHRFSILNNGITIAAREIKRVSQTVSVKDFQIINGCQTSHVLFHCKADLDDKVVLVIKAISSAEDGVIDELVVATNSQTKVADSQFFAIKKEVRAIQLFFQAYPESEKDERQLFFERRLGEFAGKEEIANTRIFDIHLLGKVYAAMFLDVPHDTLGSPGRIYDLPGLYSTSDQEIAYYTAAFCYYRLQLMLGNKQIDRADGMLKWHVLTAIRYLTLGGNPLSTPDAMKLACEQILKIVWKTPKECLALYKDAVKIVRQIPRTGEQELRAKPFTEKLITEAKKQHKATQQTARPVGRAPSK